MAKSRECRRYDVGKDPRKTRRQESAKARDEVYQALTIEEKKALIESRPGTSTRERKRLGL